MSRISALEEAALFNVLALMRFLHRCQACSIPAGQTYMMHVAYALQYMCHLTHNNKLSTTML